MAQRLMKECKGYFVVDIHHGPLPTGYVSSSFNSAVSVLIRYASILPDFSPAAYRKLPSGSRLNALVSASQDTCPMDFRRPAESTEKQAMLLWPRLATYRHLPDGVI